MTNQRYPVDLHISAQDFTDCGWKDVIASASSEGYSKMWQALWHAARSAIEQGRNEHGKVLWLLADACSMMLSPSSPNEPFKPIAESSSGRTAIPNDLTEAEISFFTEIVDVVDNNWLKARLADLVWLNGKPRNPAFALQAIDAYRSIPLDTETWIRGGEECWKRAIGLARMLKDGAGDRLEKMEVAIVTSFNAATRQDGYLMLWLADLLRAHGLGKAYCADISRKLEVLAREFENEGDLHRARDYFSAAASWYKIISDDEKSTEMKILMAESWVKEAVARASSDNPSHMVAASFYENAIQTYRIIPKAKRTKYCVDERIAELRSHLNDSGEKSLREMSVIRTPSINITKIVEDARKSVSGKSAEEALLAFANLDQGVDAEELRKSVLERMRQFPFQSLVAATTISRDGRVIAKRPPMSLRENLTENDEIAIRAEMVRDYGMGVGLVVQSCIWPALEALLLEHRLCEADFVGLASQSPIVPKDRVGLFGKSLFAGYERDWVTALHLLVPQIEHMVRVHLKQAGVQTAKLDVNGIQNENGLSALMDLPEVEQIFGKDLAFELKSLFCDPFGPNLRNELAHGLLDENGCLSPFSIYAWWLALRLVFKTWWNTAHKAEGGEVVE